MAATIPRWLLPRGAAHIEPPHIFSYAAVVPQYSHRATPYYRACRYASDAPSKPRVLEKPLKFNRPSHPARLNRAPPRQYPGPPLSAPQLEAQKTKKYPNMMPPEGSFMHWFLTNRAIHLWITLVGLDLVLRVKLPVSLADLDYSQSTLTALALFTFVAEFHRTSPFAHLTPPKSYFLSHPLDFISTYFNVYRMHVAYTSEETAKRRKKKVDDVQKRALYRKAHGLDKEQGLGGWTVKGDDEVIALDSTLNRAGGGELNLESTEAMENGKAAPTAAGERLYTDFEGRKRPIKKWLGIW